MNKKESIPPIGAILRYLLAKHRDRIVALPYTPEASRIVTLIDCLLEADREVRNEQSH